MTYDDTVVLAKESEELLLFRDMKTDAVQQMLRRLALSETRDITAGGYNPAQPSPLHFHATRRPPSA